MYELWHSLEHPEEKEEGAGAGKKGGTTTGEADERVVKVLVRMREGRMREVRERNGGGVAGGGGGKVAKGRK